MRKFIIYVFFYIHRKNEKTTFSTVFVEIFIFLLCDIHLTSFELISKNTQWFYSL